MEKNGTYSTITTTTYKETDLKDSYAPNYILWHAILWNSGKKMSSKR